jgi:glycosyltransferase involved in cell wall biosynthesis
MNCFDIGVIASVGSETISRVLLEYMYLKKPVIGTRVNAIGEIIQEGVNGALVNYSDPGAMADEIKKMLADESLMETYGTQSFHLYRRRYAEARFYEATIEVFDKAFSTPHS